VRTGEARFMRVREVNLSAKLWTVPAERMKAEDDPQGTDFEVPLSDPAIAILKAVIPKGAGPDTYVFAGQWSADNTKPLGQNAVLHALKAVYAPDLTEEEILTVGRDPFLMAHALAAPKDRCVVTTEVSKPTRRRQNRHIPDVCNDLGLQCCHTFKMLKALDFKTGWKP
jgi:hypothetical protein